MPLHCSGGQRRAERVIQDVLHSATACSLDLLLSGLCFLLSGLMRLQRFIPHVLHTWTVLKHFSFPWLAGAPSPSPRPAPSRLSFEAPPYTAAKPPVSPPRSTRPSPRTPKPLDLNQSGMPVFGDVLTSARAASQGGFARSDPLPRPGALQQESLEIPGARANEADEQKALEIRQAEERERVEVQKLKEEIAKREAVEKKSAEEAEARARVRAEARRKQLEEAERKRREEEKRRAWEAEQARLREEAERRRREEEARRKVRSWHCKGFRGRCLFYNLRLHWTCS
jgi:hypothetical protein